MSAIPSRLNLARTALPVLAATLLAGAAAAAPTPATYVAKAGAGDLYEKQSSQLVLATSKDPKVRQFATMMIKDHTTSTSEVKAAAMKSGLKPKPPMLEPAQKTMIHQLTAAKGTARDALYEQQQLKAHKMALTLHQDYAANGTAPALKTAAGRDRPRRPASYRHAERDARPRDVSGIGTDPAGGRWPPVTVSGVHAMTLIERIARVLAGQYYSRNALGEAHADSAAAVVDTQWPDFADDAVAVLKSLRDPSTALGGDTPAGWHETIEAALADRPQMPAD